MHYPVWDPGVGHGLVIALVATLHVFVSHFAIGGGLFLVVSEHRARRRGDAALLGFLKRHSAFFALLTLVFGALTGVGIWFVAGTISPAGISALIRTFLWVWALEWVCFLVEIVAAIIYYRSWDRLPARTHLLIGWIYFGAAWLSLFLINGIITFMLTPGEWAQTRSVWDAFFNPTFWPGLVGRTVWAGALAGAYGLLTAALVAEPAARRRIVRHCGAWVVVAGAATALSLWWYGATLPPPAAALVAGGVSYLPLAKAVLVWAGAAAALLALVAVVWPGLARWPGAALVLVLLLGAAGGAEWLREGARKPWVVPGLVWANGLRPADLPALEADGVLAHAAYAPARAVPADRAGRVAAGNAVFRTLCRGCHTVDGYNGLADRIRPWPEPFLADVLGYLDAIRLGTMPPLPMADDERAALAAFLRAAVPHVPPDAGGPPAAAGERLFATYCGACHTLGPNSPVRAAWAGEDEAALRAALDALADDLGDSMPVFDSTAAERAALAAFLHGALAAGAGPTGGGGE